MYSVDFFYQEPIHIEADTQEQLADDLHDFMRLYVWPVKAVNITKEPLLGGDYLEIIPINEDNGQFALEIKKVY
jgi:hypothetical protein